MIGFWMLYAVLVGALVSGAALAAEWVLRTYDRPSRGVWLAAMAAAILLPAAAFLFPEALSWRWLPGSDASAVVLLPEAVAQGEVPGPSPSRPWWMAAAALVGRLDALLMALWAASALALLGFLGLCWVRLRRERAVWEVRTVEGVRVLLSADRGPAVLGLLRTRIVLPHWALELDGDLRALVVLHEREHVRAGDHRWFALGLLVTAMLPWNPVLWWQLRRLRLAIECDCDRRVLARGVPRDRYGDLLLRAGARRPGRAVGAAALAEPRSFLERRVRAMTRGRVKNRMAKALGAGAAAVGLLALACETPTPPHDEAASDASADASGVEQGRVDDRSRFIPYDTPPKLQNRDAVRQALRDAYPSDLREAGIGGDVVLWMYVDVDGTVRKTRVLSGAGEPSLDAAARTVAERMRFAPALNRDEPTPVWVQQKVTFAGEDEGAEGGGRYRLGPGEEGGPQPLVVVDGVIRAELDLDAIDTSDIEKVEIVKGEAALDLYGDRARGGLIQITTKSGEGGGGASH